MKSLIYKGPINSLSLGNVSINLLREMYKKDMIVSIFPTGNIDVSAFDLDKEPEFKKWVEESVNKRFKRCRKEDTTLHMWHLNGGENRISSKQILYTFYELDQPTESERSIAGIQDKMVFSSSHANKCFGDKHHSVPLGFDQSFFKTEKSYLNEKTHFGLMGKFEKRKHTSKIIKTWAKKYGNNFKYQLSCCISNPFYKKDQMESAIRQTLEGKSYGNINFIPFLPKNSQVNDFLNSIDIDLGGMSGGEGWNLPSFNATCLGKWSVVLNCSSHKDWANIENCVLVNPSGKEPAYDEIFFKEGMEFNQGNIYTFEEEEFISAMEAAELLCKSVNKKGELLKDKFSYKNTLEKILE
jgi:hypothetical protein